MSTEGSFWIFCCPANGWSGRGLEFSSRKHPEGSWKERGGERYSQSAVCRSPRAPLALRAPGPVLELHLRPRRAAQEERSLLQAYGPMGKTRMAGCPIKRMWACLVLRVTGKMDALKRKPRRTTNVAWVPLLYRQTSCQRWISQRRIIQTCGGNPLLVGNRFMLRGIPRNSMMLGLIRSS